ncbi:response regulator transcription factor [Lacticaseibacillus parakribbianus]|uniref:response regulator transcription factor n=1 Tax=Lacticaseibacillus parakribbianus TaxID=2970927 RepID=UPI0021CB7DB5|nr:response regulator transcription factor [Lacticaseibacillus parakribbianus]
MELLIVEDSQPLAASYATYLAPVARVTCVCTLAAASAAVTARPPDAVILDLALPDGDGLAWLTQWRPLLAAKVLVLTANDAEQAELTGLALAEDYVVKPVSLRVLAARLAKLVPPTALTLGDMTVNLSRAELSRDGQVIALSATEWRLVAYFAQNQGQLLTRAQLLAVIWDARDQVVSDNTLTVTVKRLREKLEADPAHPALIRTIRGMGYFIET